MNLELKVGDYFRFTNDHIRKDYIYKVIKVYQVCPVSKCANKNEKVYRCANILSKLNPYLIHTSSLVKYKIKILTKDEVIAEIL